MKNKLTCLLLSTMFMTQGICVKDRIPAGGRALAMGGCAVALPGFWSVCNNQAGMIGLHSIEAGFSFENRFLAAGFMYEQLGMVIPTRSSAFGVVACRFGDSRYYEFKAGLSYARSFGRRFSASVSLDYLRIHITGDYGNANLLSSEIGLMYLADHGLCLGVHLVNPIPLKITHAMPERLPATLCIGLSYRFNEAFLTTAEASKDLDNPLIIRGGMEYRVARMAYARIGISSGSTMLTFGFGVEVGKITLDLASGYHQQLGFTPSGSLIYSFK